MTAKFICKLVVKPPATKVRYESYAVHPACFFIHYFFYSVKITAFCSLYCKLIYFYALPSYMSYCLFFCFFEFPFPSKCILYLFYF